MTESHRILLIEPDDGDRGVAASMLAALGHHVVPSAEALSAIPRLGPDRLAAIVFGIRPNDMSQLVALARIRELPAGKGVPVIVLSGANAAEQARLEMLLSQLGVVAYVGKPLSAIRLAAGLDKAIGVAPTASKRAAAGGPVTEKTLKATYTEMGRQDHFQRLGVGRSDGLMTIRQAYLAKIKHYSPEKLATPSAESRRLLRGIQDGLQTAFATLRDTERRNRYLAGLTLTAAQERRREVVGERKADNPWLGARRKPPAPRPAPPRPRTPEPTPGAEPAPPPTPRVRESQPPGPRPSRPPPTASAGPSWRLPERDTPRREPEPKPEPESEPPGVALEDVWGGRKAGDRDTVEMLLDASHLQAVMGDYAGAAQLIEQCIKLRPDHPDLKFKLEINLGRKFKGLGNLPRARRHFAAAAALSPRGNTTAQDELAELDGASGAKKGGLADRILGWQRKKKK